MILFELAIYWKMLVIHIEQFKTQHPASYSCSKVLTLMTIINLENLCFYWILQTLVFF